MISFLCKSVLFGSWEDKRLELNTGREYRFLIVIKLKGSVLTISNSQEMVIGKTGDDGGENDDIICNINTIDNN